MRSSRKIRRDLLIGLWCATLPLVVEGQGRPGEAISSSSQLQVVTDSVGQTVQLNGTTVGRTPLLVDVRAQRGAREAQELLK